MSWLTTRRAIDLLRKRKRKFQPSLLGDQDVLQADQADTAIADLVIAEQADGIRTQLAEMNDQMADCFWLCCVDEMSYADVADQLGISTNHVGVNVHRARTLLKTRLSNQCGREDRVN